MPGKGKFIERLHRERTRSDRGRCHRAWPFGRPSAQVDRERTLDVYLNNLAYWKNIPLCVWDYTIGGYQVIKKWLSYREREFLGRALKMDEARAVTDIARRVTAILLMEPELDANYDVVKKGIFSWPAPAREDKVPVSSSAKSADL